MKQSLFFSLILLCLLPSRILNAAAGDLDTSFATNGIALTPLSRSDVIYGCTVLSNDNIFVVGQAQGYLPRIGTAMYTPNGAEDTSYNGTGKKIITLGGNSQADATAVQNDGQILFCGYSYQTQTDSNVTRLNTDGSFDTTFNSVGYANTPVGNGAMANSVVEQTDNSIVVGGLAVDGQGEFMLVRYTSSGALDTSFGTGGIVINVIGYLAQINQIALQSDGKIVAGGYQQDGNGMTFCLARYETDGSLDTTFGTSGIVTTQAGANGESQISSIAIQTDGKIVAGGYALDNDGVYKFAVARYETDGSLDSGFGTSGITLTQINFESKINSIALQSDGKIIAGGYSYDELATGFALARYNTDGSIDTGFGTNGVTVTTINGRNSESRINSIGIQSTGDIIAAGYSNQTFAVARYLGS